MIVEVDDICEKTTIGKLHAGDCFFFYKDYFMKLPICVKPLDDDDGVCCGFNSVRLKDGDLMLIREKDEIIPMEAVVTIKFKKSLKEKTKWQ